MPLRTANSTYLSCVCTRVSFFSHSTQLSNAHGSICCIHWIFFLVFLPFRSVTYICTARNIFFESHICVASLLVFCLSIIWWFTPWVRIRKKTLFYCIVDLPTPTVPSYLVCPVVVVIQLGLPQAFKYMKTQNMHDPTSSLQLPFSRIFSVCHDMQSWAKELTLTYGDATIWTVCVWLPVTVEGSLWCFSHPHNSSCASWLFAADVTAEVSPHYCSEVKTATLLVLELYHLFAECCQTR